MDMSILQEKKTINTIGKEANIMPDKESENICMTDGDFFEELFAMEERIIAEVDAELEQKRRKADQ